MELDPAATDMADVILAQWGAERPELDASPMGVIGRISRAAIALDRRLAPVFAEHGINAGEFDVLATLLRAGAPYELTVGRLLAYTMVTSGAVTNRLNRLESAGLVTRRIDPNDRRGVIVALTEDGLACASAALVPHLANEKRLLATLEPEEREQLATLLRKLLLALGDAAPESGSPPAAAGLA